MVDQHHDVGHFFEGGRVLVELGECFDAISEYVVVAPLLLGVGKRTQVVVLFEAGVKTGVMKGVTPLLAAQRDVAQQFQNAPLELDVLPV